MARRRKKQRLKIAKRLKTPEYLEIKKKFGNVKKNTNNKRANYSKHHTLMKPQPKKSKSILDRLPFKIDDSLKDQILGKVEPPTPAKIVTSEGPFKVDEYGVA